MTTKQIQWRELIDVALTVEGSLGNTFNRFYDYSFGNQILLLMQGTCEPVATFNTWRQNGRYVKKGEKAKEIIRPYFYKTEDEDEQELRGFTIVKAVFGYSQTDGQDLPPVSLPNWELERALQALDIKQVPYASISGNTQGYASNREIALNPTAVDARKTAIHEIAHIVLCHTSEQSEIDRGVKEFQAETTAFLLLKELGVKFNESESRAYVQHWLKNNKPSNKDIKQVFTAVDKILKAGKGVK